jgi:L-lactate dehydrogenase complex protein LldF
MNHCPVYGAVGGHTYGWVYPGPMGAVLSPQLLGIKETNLLPNASTLCGKCEEVCPVQIPLPKLLRHWRERVHTQKLESTPSRWGLQFWNFVVNKPKLYRIFTAMSVFQLKTFAGNKGLIKWLPFAKSWFMFRELPAPEGRTFMQQMSERLKQGAQKVKDDSNE